MSPLAAAALLAAAAPDTILHPTGAAPAPFAPGAGGSDFGLAVFIVVCGAAGAWLWWRGRRRPPGLASRGERRLAVSETRSLGNRQYLVVAAYDHRRFLLGVCPGRIELLAPLDGGTPPPER